MKKQALHLSLIKKNIKAFVALFAFIIIPLLVLFSFIYKYVSFSILSVIFNVINYSIISLYVISLITLIKVSKKEVISLKKVFKFIPAILPKNILPVIIFAFAITITKQFFFIGPYVLFAVFPVVSFIAFFNSGISISEIINVNFEFNKSKEGKDLIRSIIVISLILIFFLGIINFIFRGMLSFLYGNAYFITIAVFKNTMFIIGFLILYFTATKTYADYKFIIPQDAFLSASNIILEKRHEKREKYVKKEKDRFISEKTKKPFEKENSKKKNIESNRFTNDDNSFNRFEDTKF